jgi:hypothetical protein
MFTFHGLYRRLAWAVLLASTSTAAAGVDRAGADAGRNKADRQVLADVDRALERAAAQPGATAGTLRLAARLALEDHLAEPKARSARSARPASPLLDVLRRRRLVRLVEERAAARAKDLLADRGLPPGAGSGPGSTTDSGVVHAGTGTISGTVSHATGPLYSWLILRDPAGMQLARVSNSSLTGAYSFTGLAAGAYYVQTDNTMGYVDEAWNDKQCPVGGYARDCGGEAITLAEGGAATGIDFTLVRGGGVGGTVTASATGSPINGVYMIVYDAQGRYASQARTSSSGGYTTYHGLPSGTYFVLTQDAYAQGYVDEVYDGLTCVPYCAVTSATPVVVTSPSTTPAIDFSLDVGGSIAGRITDEATGLPVSGATAYVYSSTGAAIRPVTSAADGTYSLGGLPTGTYHAWGGASGYLTEIYSQLPCARFCEVLTGDPIPVTQGVPTGGIDFSLSKSGTISGVVTRADDAAAVPGVEVVVQAENRESYSATTDSAGGYSVTSLRPGRYVVVARPSWSSLNLVDEVHDGVPCVSCDPYALGSQVTVTSGGAVTGVDFSLTPGGTISGTVTNAATGTPVSGSAAAFKDESMREVADADVDASGHYRLTGIPAGRYFVAAASFSGEVAEVYDDLPVTLAEDFTRGTPVVVGEAATVLDVDFALSPGGRVSGTVARASDGQPASGADVFLHDESGTLVSEATADAAGAYTTTLGVPTGTYFAFAEGTSGLSGQLYKGIDCLDTTAQCAVTGGEPLQVTAPATLGGIHFRLVAGGAISGRVTAAATGLPVAYASVEAYVATGSRQVAVGSEFTDTGGLYTIAGLPAGQYFLRASEPAWFTAKYVPEVYDDVACLACDVRAGRAVTVSDGGVAAGVDFALATGGEITGKIRTSSGAAIGSRVLAHDSTGRLVADTDDVYDARQGDGTYAVRGLPAGTYFVRTANRAGFVDEAYDGVPCPAGLCPPGAGTGVPVTAGASVSGIDFVLEPGGAVSGFVTGPDGLGAFGGVASAYDASGTLAGSVSLAPNGYYRIPGLAPGSHYVVASGAHSLVPQVYDAVACLGCNPVASGTPVTVGAGTATGIDFQLVQGGRISGHVVDGAGNPVAGATVGIHSATGASVGTTRSDGRGFYHTFDFGLVPGTYFAVAEKPGVFDRLLYGGGPCGTGCDPTTGTPIVVSGGATAGEVDFALRTEALDFYTLAPCRLVDTRGAAGALGGPAMAANTDRNFALAGSCGVPFEAKALSVNVTATGAAASGNLRLHAGRSRVPGASSLNFKAGVTRANNAIVPLSAIGELAVYCASPGSADVIVDVNGYFR